MGTLVFNSPLLIFSEALIRFIIGLVNLVAKEMATAIDKNSNKVTTIIYIIANVIFIPSWLFHLGAYTDLEHCELNQDDTYETNTQSVKYAVEIANEMSIPLLYISTAGIFDGKKEVYDELDLPNPKGHYAKSKYMGEKYVIENANDYLICRAGWMMGGGPEKDK